MMDVVGSTLGIGAATCTKQVMTLVVLQVFTPLLRDHFTKKEEDATIQVNVCLFHALLLQAAS